MLPIIIAVVVMIIICFVFFFFFMKKKGALQDTFANRDFSTELHKADGYLSESLNSDYAFLKKYLNDTPIDSFTIATFSHTTGDVFKNAAKDALKGIATLGTVRYQTVKTPKYLVLSGDNLHLLDSDTDGSVSQHLIFERRRLEMSTISRFTEIDTEQKQLNNAGMENLKRYTISLQTDTEPINLVIYDFLVTDVNNVSGKIMLMSASKLEKNRILGLSFLKKLGDKYPNLKAN